MLNSLNRNTYMYKRNALQDHRCLISIKKKNIHQNNYLITLQRVNTVLAFSVLTLSVKDSTRRANVTQCCFINLLYGIKLIVHMFHSVSFITFAFFLYRYSTSNLHPRFLSTGSSLNIPLYRISLSKCFFLLNVSLYMFLFIHASFKVPP